METNLDKAKKLINDKKFEVRVGSKVQLHINTLYAFKAVEITATNNSESVKKILKEFQKWILDGYKPNSTILEILGTDDVLNDFIETNFNNF